MPIKKSVRTPYNLAIIRHETQLVYYTHVNFIIILRHYGPIVFLPISKYVCDEMNSGKTRIYILCTHDTLYAFHHTYDVVVTQIINP
jgi:hypothetical protein